MLHGEKVKHTPKFSCVLSRLVVDLKKNTTSSMHFQKMQSGLLLPNFVLPGIFLPLVLSYSFSI